MPGSLAKRLECLPKARQTEVLFQVSRTKDSKMVLDASLLNTPYYKVLIKGKVEQSKERSSALPYIAIEKGAFRPPSIMVANFTFLVLHYSWKTYENKTVIHSFTDVKIFPSCCIIFCLCHNIVIILCSDF